MVLSGPVHRAHCACGAVTVVARGTPVRSMLCSCAACRRKTGSAFNWTLYWPEADVEIDGSTTAHRRAGQQGRSAEVRACAGCGGSVWWRMEALPGEIAVGGGFFDDPAALPAPTAAYWTEGRPDWAADLSGIPSKPRQ